MKFLVVVLVAAGLYLFYPFHSLYVRDDPFSDSWFKAESGFWTREGCDEEARARKAREHRCREETLWSRLFTTYRQYGRRPEGAEG